jgi:hypothetical protein
MCVVRLVNAAALPVSAALLRAGYGAQALLLLLIKPAEGTPSSSCFTWTW